MIPPKKSQKQTKQGFFITIEGGEGVGKSSFVKGLQERLSKSHRHFFVTREPGGTSISEALRGIFASFPVTNPYSELFILSASRLEHINQKILPALSQGKIVLCDRFTDSTRVYQGALGGVPEKELENILALSTQGLSPDITFILDCPTEVSLKRLKNRSAHLEESATKRYDEASVDFHKKVRESFQNLANKNHKRIVQLDAQKPLDDLIEEALVTINQKMKQIND